MRLELEGLNNTRDLGGMVTKDGLVIRPNRLLRSGMLYGATPDDLKVLKKHGVTKIVDFRTGQEIKEKPDPFLEGVTYIHLPAFEQINPGLTRDKRSDQKAIHQSKTSNVKNIKQVMIEMYEKLVTDAHSVRQYRRFIHEVMENEHATLWHCTAGKDRAGLATVIVLEILGVDRGLIIDDYLLTQTYLKPEVDELIVLLTEADPTLDPDLLRIFFGTDREYIQTVYKVVEETYGNFDAFVHTGLQVTDAQIESFCQHCLIKG